MNHSIPVCGEGDTPILVVKKLRNRWVVSGVNGMSVSVNYRYYCFPTYEAAAAFAREWYGGLDEEFKRILSSPEKCVPFAGRKAKNGRRQQQRLAFIAARYCGEIE